MLYLIITIAHLIQTRSVAVDTAITSVTPSQKLLNMSNLFI